MRFSNHDSPKYANDVNTTNYCHDDLYADVIPEGGQNLTRILSYMSFREWRFSKRSASYLTHHKNWHIYVKIPNAEDVFTAWMKDNGFEIKLSSPRKDCKTNDEATGWNSWHKCFSKRTDAGPFEADGARQGQCRKRVT